MASQKFTMKTISATKLRNADLSDVAAIVSVYMDSFANEIFSRQIFPRGFQSSLDYWTATVMEEMAEPGAVWLVVTEEEDQAIQGFLKLTRPGAPFPEPGTDGYPPEGYPVVAAEFYAKVMGAHHERMKDTPHWYVDMMGVRRAKQGNGYATSMLNWGVERSREDGCPLYVDATGDARTFYERLGFVVKGDVTVATPQGPAIVYLMLREANS